MKLHDTLLQTYDNFTLDTSKIEFHSTNERNVELPYHGPMPEQFTGTSASRIYFNIQPNQCNVLLKADKPNGKLVKAIVEATNTEIDYILGRFFFDKGQTTPGCIGLEPYWQGVWTAHYIDWKKIVRA